MRVATLAKLEREAAAFNALYPVGTPVEYWPLRRRGTPPNLGVITHPAEVLVDRVAVWVKNSQKVDTPSMDWPIASVQPLTRLKCRTLYQPYASSFAHRLKTIETAGYPAEKLGLRSGDLLAIHAAKRKVGNPERELAWRAGLNAYLGDRNNEPVVFPYSAVLCVVRYLESALVVRLGGLSETERALGDYSPGRWGWRCELVKTFAEPLPASGRQGISWWDVPEGVTL